MLGAVIVRRAGLPCMLMTLTLRACHAWGNPTLMLCSTGITALAGCAYSVAGQAAFSAAHYSCASGLPEQDARQWGSRSGCSFTQGPKEHDRPGPACHQSHRPSNWAFVVQPGSIRVPPLAYDGGDVRGGQISLPRRSSFVRQLVGTSCGGLCGMLPGGSEVISSDATLTSNCLQSPQTCTWLSRQPNQRQPPLRGRQDRAHAQHDTASSQSTKDTGQDRLGFSASEVLLISQAERGGAPSLTPAGPPRKQPLMCLLSPCSALGAEQRVLLVPHGPILAPGCPTAKIAEKIKHIHFRKREK